MKKLGKNSVLELSEVLKGGDNLAESLSSPCTIPVPDLSLRISPPRSTPSSTSTERESSTNFGNLGRFDSPNGCALKPLRSDSSTLKESDTELSLFPSSPFEAESPWRSLEENGAYGFFKKRSVVSHVGINAPPGVPEKLQPITGTPIYNRNNALCNSAWLSFPSVSADYSCYFPRSCPTFASPTTGPRLENGTRPMGNTVESRHQLEYCSRGGGSVDFSSNNRLRFVSKPQANRRNMRAPRMRWTTCLHARFVRAVKLLGGHESKPLQTSKLISLDLISNPLYCFLYTAVIRLSKSGCSWI